jgi:hypothetical protein
MWVTPLSHDPIMKIRIDLSETPFITTSILPDHCIPISNVTEQDGHVDYLIPSPQLKPIKLDDDMYEETKFIPEEATFHNFIQSLTDLERVLLEQCHEVDHDGPSLLEILACLDLSAELIIVSDGGAATHHGSFGWVIGTLT